MEWFTGNVFFIVVLVFCIVMHFFMHGGHGGHGGHGRPGRRDAKDDTPRHNRPRT